MARNIYTLWLCSLFLCAACSESPDNGERPAIDTIISQPTVTNRPVTGTTTAGSKNSIMHYITTSMAGWTVPHKDEWEKYWYDRYNREGNTVFRVQSDFDGNNQSDYALILKDTIGRYAVWSFMATEGSYTPYRVYDITRLADRKLHVGLGVLKAGTYNDLNTAGSVPAKVRTEHPAIHVVFFETAAKAYYWKDSSFHLIQTGD